MSIALSSFTPLQPPESILTKMDLVLIAAGLLAVTAATHHAHIRTGSNVAFISADLPDVSNGQALLKARMGFARRIGS